MSRLLVAIATATIVFIATPHAIADVVEVAPQGFIVRTELGVEATPDAVWKALLDVGRWWNMDHSYSRDGANLTIDARPGGCFCEKLANGGGVVHATVLFVAPNQTLRLQGGLGPMQGEGVAGTLTFRIVPATVPSASRIEMTYAVGGYRPSGFERVAPAVNMVMTEQVTRLKTFIETGKPVAAPK